LIQLRIKIDFIVVQRLERLYCFKTQNRSGGVF